MVKRAKSVLFFSNKIAHVVITRINLMSLKIFAAQPTLPGVIASSKPRSMALLFNALLHSENVLYQTGSSPRRGRPRSCPLLGPNDREDALARSLEHVYQFVGLYLFEHHCSSSVENLADDSKVWPRFLQIGNRVEGSSHCIGDVERRCIQEELPSLLLTTSFGEFFQPP